MAISLAKRGSAVLAVIAVMAAQLALAVCQCQIAAAFQTADSSPKASCCSHCTPSDQAVSAPAAPCCTSPENCSDCPGCTCSAPSVLALPSGFNADQLLLLPSHLLAANWSAGILEIDSTIAALGDQILTTPPGVWLHALLCVWRN